VLGVTAMDAVNGRIVAAQVTRLRGKHVHAQASASRCAHTARGG
jgi:hypothetical protein